MSGHFDENPAPQWGLQTAFDNRDWDAVENWWRDWHAQNPDDPEPLKALLESLRDIVPMVTVENLMERTARHLLPGDDPEKWEGNADRIGEAKILALGELEAAAEGDPASSDEIWSEYRTRIEGHLKVFAQTSAKQSDAPELSQRQHALDALDLLERLDTITFQMLGEMPSKEDRDWLAELISDVALLAFDAGRHTQEAWSKGFEHHAVRGEGTLKNASEGGIAKKETQTEQTIEVLREVEEAMSRGLNVSQAAANAFKKGFGSSAAANRQL